MIIIIMYTKNYRFASNSQQDAQKIYRKILPIHLTQKCGVVHFLLKKIKVAEVSDAK